MPGTPVSNFSAKVRATSDFPFSNVSASETQIQGGEGAYFDKPSESAVCRHQHLTVTYNNRKFENGFFSLNGTKEATSNSELTEVQQKTEQDVNEQAVFLIDPRNENRVHKSIEAMHMVHDTSSFAKKFAGCSEISSQPWLLIMWISNETHINP